MKHSRRILSVACFAVAVACIAVLHSSCGGSSQSNPTPLPSGPNPGTSSTAAPLPASGCRFGYGSHDTEDEETVPVLLPYLEAAMEQLIEKQPQLFDLGDEKDQGSRAFRVLARDAYLKGLIANLEALGLCAQLDAYAPTQDIVQMKDSNAFSETYKVLLGSGHMRRGTAAYRLTSTPANFPVPWTDDYPPSGSGCYEPLPPPIYKMNCKFHLKAGDHDVLDSTPIVADPSFCAAIGMGELSPGVIRIQCPVRPEGWEFGDRRACEDWRVGTSQNSNSPGPTWRNPAGELCKGRASGCEVSPDTPYQLWVYDRTGIYTVCAQTGKCCPVDIEAER